MTTPAPPLPPTRRELLARHPELAPLQESLTAAVEVLCACARGGGQVLVCGNGGSAADADHIVAELMKSFVLRREPSAAERARLQQAAAPAGGGPAAALEAAWPELVHRLQRGVPAIALGAHGALVTAIANDTDARLVFAQQVYVYGRPGDVLWALSTSGNSANIVAALRVARARGLRTVGLTGSAPAAADPWCDVLVKVPAHETFAVQEYHLPIYHAICLRVEETLFGVPPAGEH